MRISRGRNLHDFGLKSYRYSFTTKSSIMSNSLSIGFRKKVFLIFICFVGLIVVTTSCNQPDRKTSVITNWINWKVPKKSIKFDESEKYVRDYLDSINTEKHTSFRIVNWKSAGSSDTSLFTATGDLQSVDSITPPAPPLPGPRIESIQVNN